MAEKSTYVLSKKPKIIEIDLRSSENGDVEVPRRTGGGPYEFYQILLKNPCWTSFGDSHVLPVRK
jgi:hypothetical protein